MTVNDTLSDTKRGVVMEQILVMCDPQKALIKDDTSERIREILTEGTAENTRKAYQGDIEYFMTWARFALGYDMGFPVPCPVVVRFITDHLKGMDEDTERKLLGLGIKGKSGTHSLNTIIRRIASLSAAHEAQKVENPCRSREVSTLLSKARRASAKKGELPNKRKALTRDLLELVISTCDDSIIGIRDKALLLFGFASGGRRRSEVASAMVKDLMPVDGGYIYHLPLSKTDQEGNGLDLPILGKAAVALDAWLRCTGIAEGKLFRGVTKGGRVLDGINDKTVARIVKKRSRMAGLDPSRFSGHSIRSGFITEAGRQGKSLGDTMAMSGHKTVRVALGYHQSGAAINNPAAMLLG